MPALVDTSAWIEFFHPRGHRIVQRVLATALEEGIVVTAAPVLTELLAGFDLGRATDRRAIERLRALEIIGLEWDVCVRAGGLGRRLGARGRRVPTVDLMIAAAAAAGGHDVWHAGDTHFAAIERVGGPRQRNLGRPGR
jgi:predicted nucleic acid-binding protein